MIVPISEMLPVFDDRRHEIAGVTFNFAHADLEGWFQISPLLWRSIEDLTDKDGVERRGLRPAFLLPNAKRLADETNGVLIYKASVENEGQPLRELIGSPDVVLTPGDSVSIESVDRIAERPDRPLLDPAFGGRRDARILVTGPSRPEPLRVVDSLEYRRDPPANAWIRESIPERILFGNLINGHLRPADLPTVDPDLVGDSDTLNEFRNFIVQHVISGPKGRLPGLSYFGSPRVRDAVHSLLLLGWMAGHAEAFAAVQLGETRYRQIQGLQAEAARRDGWLSAPAVQELVHSKLSARRIAEAVQGMRTNIKRAGFPPPPGVEQARKVISRFRRERGLGRR